MHKIPFTNGKHNKTEKKKKKDSGKPQQKTASGKNGGSPARRRVSNIRAQGKEYFRQYYHANNHDIPCECGCAVKKGSMKTHLATRKHFFHMHFKNFEASQVILEN